MTVVQVGTDHIEAMLAAANRYGAYPGGGMFSFRHAGERHCLCVAEDFEAFGLLLWETNAASVHACGPSAVSGPHEDEEPGSAPELAEHFRFGRRYLHAPSPVETLKLCACYRYQASGSETWESSEAAAFVDALEHCAISALPGYGDAP